MMRRRLFLNAGSAATVATLAACGGGGGGGTPTGLEGSSAGTGATAAGGATADSGSTATAGTTPTNTASADAGGTPQQQQGSTPANATDAGMPAKVLAVYYTVWNTGTHQITEVPTDFNVIYVFHAMPAGNPVNGNRNNLGDGSFTFEHYANVTPGQVQACRQRGQKVLLTVGGHKAGYAWDNRAKSTNFVNSFRRIYNNLGGVDGLDFNNFEASILNDGNLTAVTNEMIWIARELKKTYGPGFAITAPPQPGDPRQRSLMAGLKRAGVLTYCGAQYYDWDGFKAPGYIKGSADEWIRLLDGEEKSFVVGLSGGYGNGLSLAECIREWDNVKAAHPDVRGMFCWSAQHVMDDRNTWINAMKTRLA